MIWDVIRANLTKMVNLVIICQGCFENWNEMAKESALERDDFDRDCESLPRIGQIFSWIFKWSVKSQEGRWGAPYNNGEVMYLAKSDRGFSEYLNEMAKTVMWQKWRDSFRVWQKKFSAMGKRPPWEVATLTKAECTRPSSRFGKFDEYGWNL